MKIEQRFRKTWRNGGGIYLGFRYQFPINILLTNKGQTATLRVVSIGLVFWQWNIDILSDFREDEI